jgi:hypothetical protein
MRPVANSRRWTRFAGTSDDEDAEAAEDAGKSDDPAAHVAMDPIARHTSLHGRRRYVGSNRGVSFCVLSNLCVLIRIQNQNTTCAAPIGSRCTRPPSRALS